MREVFGAVIATGLVLVAVFVPVAFFPGTTGRLYAQFSMTIAFAVALSVFNAVTLTPALSALLLERESHHKGTVLLVLRDGSSAAAPTSTSPGCAAPCAARWAVVVLFVGALGLTYWVYRTVPQAFVPEEDQGYFLIQVQAPAGASLEYTAQRRPAGREDHHGGSRRAGAVLGHGVQLQRRGAEPGAHVRAAEAIRRAAGRGALASRPSSAGSPGRCSACRARSSSAFSPPSIPGLSRFGGFEFQVLDQTGQDITNLAQRHPGASPRRATSRGIVRGLFSAFTANDPQLQVTIDRQRALALGLPLNEITSAMQIFLGSQYVNDFEFNNRAYRVYVQADQQFRSNPQALRQLYARTQRRRDGAARAGRDH